jgi:cell volume regulation protein A
MGFVCGKIGKIIINRIKLDYEGLYIVLLIAIMFFTFSATDFIGGNGFLAIYLCAIYLGNHKLMHKSSILKSFDGFAWLMQIVLFLTLGLLVHPNQIMAIEVAGIGLIISAFLILVARPVTVFITLIAFKIQNRKRWFISWVGLRGAVPIVFATYPVLAGIDKNNMIFNIVFFISLSSILIQGTTLPLVAKWLHLTVPQNLKPKTLIDLEIEESIKSILTAVTIAETSDIVGKKIVDLNFPLTAWVSFIIRNGKYVTPTGNTIIEAKDKLYILCENKDSIAEVHQCLGIIK